MKKITLNLITKNILFYFLALNSVNSFCQQLLNNGFENWGNQTWGGIVTVSEPANWTSSNGNNIFPNGFLENDTFPVIQDADAFEGASSISLHVRGAQNGNVVNAGFYSAINFDYSNFDFNSAYGPFIDSNYLFQSTGNLIPDSLVCYVKYIGVDQTSLGQASIEVRSSPVNDQTSYLGYALNQNCGIGTNDINEWTRMSFPIYYIVEPTTQIYVICMFGVSGAVGTELKIDAVEIIYKNSQVGLVEKSIKDFQFYPNPASEKIKVSFEAQNEAYTISILDLQGRTLQANEFSNLSGAQTIELNLTDLVQGKYLVEVSSEVATTTRMIVVD